jgi:hypothetical protein
LHLIANLRALRLCVTFHAKARSSRSGLNRYQDRLLRIGVEFSAKIIKSRILRNDWKAVAGRIGRKALVRREIGRALSDRGGD